MLDVLEGVFRLVLIDLDRPDASFLVLSISRLRRHLFRNSYALTTMARLQLTVSVNKARRNIPDTYLIGRIYLDKSTVSSRSVDARYVRCIIYVVACLCHAVLVSARCHCEI